MLLRTVIVEDEPLSRIFLQNLIGEFCPDIEIVGHATTEDEAVAVISSLSPDLVFLDLELQQGTGFGVLKRVDKGSLRIIFTTAYDHYAINAIRLSGTEYLLKPFDYESLKQAIKKVCGNSEHHSEQLSLRYLLSTLENNNTPLHIALETSTGVEYVLMSDVISIEAVEREIRFALRNGEIRSSGASLKDWDLLLNPHSFFRTHQSCIINLKEVKIINPSENSKVKMSDNSEVAVSEKKLEELREMLKNRTAK